MKSELDAMLATFPQPSWRPAAAVVMLLMLASIGWAARTELPRIAIAQGSVAPQGQVRTVQHLEGGIVQEILVREGDHVTAGQPLARLDLGGGGLDIEEIRVRLDGLRLERARLMAEVSHLDLTLPADESERRPDLAKAERAAFLGRRREYESSLAVLRDQKSQKEMEVRSISSRLDSAKRRLEPLRTQFDIATKLAEAKLAPRTQALVLQHDVTQVEGEIAALEIALPQSQTALAEARERELYERNRFRKSAAERLREVESEIERQQEQMTRADSQIERTLLVSPVDGVLKNLKLNTIGGVVAPREPIVEIVPSDETLVVEARLSPNDVGHVRVGQPAVVKLSSYNYLAYGSLSGRVERVAADANVDESGEHYFRLLVALDQDRLQIGEDVYPLSPGMKAEVDIELGARSMLRYLVEPVMKLRSEAFRGH